MTNTTTTPKLKTNSKQVKTAVQNYIIECLDNSGYPECKDDIKSKLELVCDEFKNAAVFENNIKRLGTWQAVFIDWLGGLPSALSIEYYTKEILSLMASFGLPLPENKTEQEGEDLFRYLIYSNFLDLCKKHKVDYYSYLKY
jgi:hypothetical protein